MAHLQTLDGQPLSWPELLRRNAEWHATHDRHGNVLALPAEERWLPVRGCYNCRSGLHGVCNGTRPRNQDDRRPVVCECHAREHSAEVPL